MKYQLFNELDIFYPENLHFPHSHHFHVAHDVNFIISNELVSHEPIGLNAKPVRFIKEKHLHPKSEKRDAF